MPSEFREFRQIKIREGHNDSLLFILGASRGELGKGRRFLFGLKEEVTSPKMLIELPKTYKKRQSKENIYIGSVVREIFPIALLLFLL